MSADSDPNRRGQARDRARRLFADGGYARVPVHAVACPRCGALPSEICVDRGGRQRARSHQARYRALVG